MSSDAVLRRLEADFRLEQEVGRGGFGAVWRAHSLKTGAPVAVKLANPAKIEDIRDRILRETALIASVDHPRLARFYGIYQSDDGSLALIYEFVEGRPLNEVWSAGEPPPPTKALSWLEDVAGALDHLHNVGLLHRDVKPENVMLEPDGRAKLLDFGLTRTEASGSTITKTGTVLGTPGYLAPEAFEQSKPSRSQDLYALGVLAYWLLQGTIPFRAESPYDIYLAQVDGTPAPLTRLPPEIRQQLRPLFFRALSPKPEERFPSGARLVRALRSGMRVVAAPATGNTTRSVAPVRAKTGRSTPQRISGRSRKFRRRLVLSFGLAVGTAGLLLAGGWLWDGPLPPTPKVPTTATPLPPEEASFGPFTAEYVDEALHDLESAEGWWLGPDGSVTRDAGEVSVDHVALVSPDPFHWPTMLHEVPTLRRFTDWIRSGGRPEKIPAELATGLERIDDAFAEVSLPRPYQPFLSAAPQPRATPLPLRIREIDAPLIPGAVLPEVTRGWFASAALQLDLAAAASAPRLDDIATEKLQLPMNRTFTLGEHRERPARSLGISFGSNLQGRLVTTAAMGAAALRLQAGLYAAVRSMREEPGTAEMVACVLGTALEADELTVAWLGHLAFLSPELLLIGEPRSGAEWFLRGRVLRIQNGPYRHGFPSSSDLRARMVSAHDAAEFDALRRACAPPPEGAGPWALRRRALAFGSLASSYQDAKEYAALGALLQEAWSWLPEVEPELRVLQLGPFIDGVARSNGPLGIPAEQLQEILDLTRSNLDAFSAARRESLLQRRFPEVQRVLDRMVSATPDE